MTPEEKLKQLAEKAAEFLGADAKRMIPIRDDNTTHELYTYPYNLFESSIDAPILAHLALKKMEKNFFVQYQTDTGMDLQLIHIWHFTPRNPPFIKGGGDSHTEKYIALWSAIIETGEK